MFSVYKELKIPPDRGPFLNYIVCLAIVRAIKHLSRLKLQVIHEMSSQLSQRQGQEVDVRIKWPNDIYFKDLKIGGVLLNSVLKGSSIHLITGT